MSVTTGSAPAATSAATTPAAQPAFLSWAARHGHVAHVAGLSVRDAMIAAGLDFRVTLDEIHARDKNDGTLHHMPTHFATMRRDRDGSVTPLDVVRTRYSVCQNVDALDYAQGLIDDYGANIAAGAAHGNPIGSKAYLALRSPNTVTVANSTTTIYVVINNSHDGNTGVTGTIHAIEKTTGADLGIAMAAAAQRWIIRHSGNLEAKHAKVLDTVGMVDRWCHTFENMTRVLLGKILTSDQIDAYVAAVLPTPTTGGTRSENTWARRRAVLTDLIRHNPDHAGFGTRSAMAVFNMTCLYIDHYAPARGGDADMIRAQRALEGRNVLTKERAWRLLSEQIGH